MGTILGIDTEKILGPTEIQAGEADPQMLCYKLS